MSTDAPLPQNLLLVEQLPALLAKRGWTAVTADDHAALDELVSFITHTVAHFDITTRLNEFVAKRRDIDAPASEAPTEGLTATTVELIADLNLLPRSFTETGVVERLVAHLAEKDLALTLARAELVTRNAVVAAALAADTPERAHEILLGTTVVSEEPPVLNNDIAEQLAAWLSARGWTARTANDHVAFDKLAHTLFDANTFMDSLYSADEIVDAFIRKNTPPAK